MEIKRFKPKIDKLFWLIFIPSALLMLGITALALIDAPAALFIMIPCDLLVFYFLITTLFGYVELRENEVFIKFGFFMKRAIPYEKIRGFTKERKFYSDSMTSLKNAFDHVNIKYNTFDVVSVSVTDNEALIAEIEKRRQQSSAAPHHS